MNIAGYLISLIFLYLTFKDVNFDEVTNYFSVTGTIYIVGAGFTIVLFFIIRALYQINNLQYINKNLPFLDSISSLGIAQLYNVILPARMGEIIRVYFISRKHDTKKASLLAYILIEKLLDVLVILALFLGVTYFLIEINYDLYILPIYMMGGIIILAILIAIYLIFHKHLLKFLVQISPKRISSMVSAIHSDLQVGLKAFQSKDQILKGFVLLLVSWVCIFASYALVTYPFILLLGLPAYSAIVFMVFSALSFSIPSAPGGIGVVHYGLYLSVTLLGGDTVATQPDAVAAFVISTHFFVVLFDVVIGASIIAIYKLHHSKA